MSHGMMETARAYLTGQLRALSSVAHISYTPVLSETECSQVLCKPGKANFFAFPSSECCVHQYLVCRSRMFVVLTLQLSP